MAGDYPKMPLPNTVEYDHPTMGRATKQVAVCYPSGHPKAGELVIFQNAEEEKAYYGGEMTTLPEPEPLPEWEEPAPAAPRTVPRKSAKKGHRR